MDQPPKKQQAYAPHRRWLAIDTATWWMLTAAGAAAIILGVGGLYLVQLLVRPLALLILGITLAAALAPFVRALNQRVPRPLAILLVYLTFAAILAGLIWSIVPSIASQAQELGTRLPDMIDSSRQWIDRWFGGLGGGTIGETLTSLIGTVGQTLLRLPLSITSALAGVVLVVFLSFYMLIEAPNIEGFLCSLFPADQRQQAGEVMDRMLQMMGGYVRGVMIMGLVIGVLTTIGLSLLGVQFSLVLGVICGLLEMLPVVGPLISGVIVLGVTLLQTPEKALYALIFVILLQQVENQVLVPIVMRRQTNISPLVSLLALFAGGVVGGFLGILIAIPLAAALQVLTTEVLAPAIRRATNGGEYEEGTGT